MTALIVIPIADGRWLALDEGVFRAALVAGERFVRPIAPLSTDQSPDCGDLVDAEEAGRRLSVAPSWLLQQARLNEIPHVKLGKYVRFSVAQVSALLHRGPGDQRISNPPVPPKTLIRKGK